MRASGFVLCWGLLVGMWLTGCTLTEPELRPELPEEYVLPPSDDPRFSMPPQYPKETLNTPPFKRFTSPGQRGGMPHGPGALGGTRGMRGY